MERTRACRQGLMALAWLLLACSSHLATAAEHNRGLKQDDKAKAPQPAPAPVQQKKSSVVPTAGEVVLTNGVGDVLATGKHSAPAKQYDICSNRSLLHTIAYAKSCKGMAMVPPLPWVVVGARSPHLRSALHRAMQWDS